MEHCQIQAGYLSQDQTDLITAYMAESNHQNHKCWLISEYTQ